MVGMIFKHKFEVGLDDINLNYKMTDRAILKCFENTAALHSDSIQNGLEDISKNQQTWVLIEWTVDIQNRPKYGDKISVRTWVKPSLTRYVYRDFEIRAGGKTCIKATSKWAIIDLKSKTIVRASKELLDAYQPEEDEAIPAYSLGRLRVLEKYSEHKKVAIRKSDIDVNRHVNNLNYFHLIGELMDFGEQFNYFRIIYKKEIKYGDQITVCRQNADGTAYFLLKDQAEQPRAIIECR
jgi:Acyl-ACP thioesterase